MLSPLREAPIIHLRLAESTGDRLADEKLLQSIVDDALSQGKFAQQLTIISKL